MARDIPVLAQPEINAQETIESFHVLLSITTDSTTYFFCDNSTDITSRGVTYVPLPFQTKLLGGTTESPPRATLTLSGVTQEFISDIRNAGSAFTVKFSVVMHSDPDSIIASYEDMIMRSITYNAFTVSGQLTQENFVSTRYPRHVKSGLYFPGMV